LTGKLFIFKQIQLLVRYLYSAAAAAQIWPVNEDRNVGDAELHILRNWS